MRTLFPLLLIACGPPDVPNVRAQVPEIGVAPDRVAFGDQAVPLRTTSTFFLTNAGRADLEVAIVLRDDAEVFDLGATEALLGPDQSVEVEVGFTPATFLDYTGDLVLTSNDEDTPELVLPVTGTGIAAPLPDIAVSALSIDFGEIDTERTEVLTITNAGSAPLRLGDVDQIGSPAFELLTDPTDTTIAPGDDLPVVLRYAPVDTSGDGGTLSIHSNDPDENPVDVVLLGNGGADFEYPIARIACPGQTDPPAFVSLDGLGSEDPEGHTPLSYEWTLAEVPEDAAQRPISDGFLTNAVGPRTDLWADAVGTYVVELVVENAIGVRSAPDRCTIESIPDEEILVELTWSTSNADLDLHLAQQGTPLFERPGDASWCNRRPSWGAAGTADDPGLDLDDRAGFGPENMNIDVAANGRYDVRVHYFEDQGDDVVTASVRVYLHGELALDVSQNLSRNEVWDAARINWPEATAAALGVPLYTPPRRQCYGP